MENNSLAFIEKAITKTKNKSLQWNSLYMNSHLLNVQSVLTPTASPFSDTLLEKRSFYCTYKNGYIFLLCYGTDGAIFFPSSYSLEIQTSISSYPKTIAESDTNIEIDTQLKRLYNLVEDSYSNVSSFIDDFLNS